MGEFSDKKKKKKKKEGKARVPAVHKSRKSLPEFSGRDEGPSQGKLHCPDVHTIMKACRTSARTSAIVEANIPKKAF